MNDSRRPRNLKPYEKPTVTTLTREQAMLKLRAHAVRGDAGAKKLFERMLAHAPTKTLRLLRTKGEWPVGILPDRLKPSIAT